MASILVVDDHADTCNVVVRLLNTNGHSASGVSSSAEAMASISKSLPDVMLLDMMMPDMSGMELLDVLRNSKEFAKLPVVVYSADEKFGPAALSSGAQAFLLKSEIDWDALSALLEKAAAAPRE